MLLSKNGGCFADRGIKLSGKIAQITEADCFSYLIYLQIIFQKELLGVFNAHAVYIFIDALAAFGFEGAAQIAGIIVKRMSHFRQRKVIAQMIGYIFADLSDDGMLRKDFRLRGNRGTLLIQFAFEIGEGQSQFFYAGRLEDIAEYSGLDSALCIVEFPHKRSSA